MEIRAPARVRRCSSQGDIGDAVLKIERKRAVQAHPVPDSVYRPGSIWHPEITKTPTIVRDDEEPEYPVGASTANGMQGVPLYRCNYCETVVAGSETDAHRCT